MKTSKKLIKKAICLFLIAILNINTFGAIVSDNDGSAFITKAEFDALKSSFQKQVDEYNTSIDSKIDGAIAAYLAGIKLSSEVSELSLLNQVPYVFVSSWNYNPTQISSYGKAYINILFSTAIIQEDAQCYSMEWKIATSHRDAPAMIGYGTSSSSYWAKYNLYGPSKYNSSYMAFTGTVTGYPLASLTATYMTGDSDLYPTSSTPGKPKWTHNNGYIVTKSGYNEAGTIYTSWNEWGMYSTNLTGTIFGRSMTAMGNVTFNHYDSNITPQDGHAVSGNTVSGTTLSVHNDNISLMGNALGPVYTQDGWQARKTRSSGNIVSKQNIYSTSTYGVYLYQHYYTTRDYTGFIIDDVSQVAQEPVYYYSGLPLFKASQKGTVEIELNCIPKKNSSNYYRYQNKSYYTTLYNNYSNFVIKENSFSNVTLSNYSLGNLEELKIYKKNSDGTKTDITESRGNNIYPNETLIISFKVDKGKTYWLKANPTDTYTPDCYYTTTYILNKTEL